MSDRGRKGRGLSAPAARASSAGASSRAGEAAAKSRAASAPPPAGARGAAAAFPDWDSLRPESQLRLYTALFQDTDGEHDFHSEGQAFAIYKATRISISLTTTTGAAPRQYDCTMEELLTHYLSGIRGWTRKEGRFKLFAARNFPTLGHKVNILSAFGALEITQAGGGFKVQGTTASYPNYAALPPGEYTTTRDVARRILVELAPSAADGRDKHFIMCDGCPDPPGSYNAANPDANPINVLHTMATAADSSTGFSGYPTALHLIGEGKPAVDEFTMTPNILMSLTKSDIRFKLVGKPGAGNFFFVVMENGAELCGATFPGDKSSGPSITYLANLASDDALLNLACDRGVSEAKFEAEYKKRTGNKIPNSMWNFREILQCLKNAPHNWTLAEIKSMLFTEKGNGDQRTRLEREKLYQLFCKALVSIDELCSLNGASCNVGEPEEGEPGDIEDGLRIIRPLDYTSMYTHGDNSVEIYKLPPRDEGAQKRLVYDSCVFAVLEHNNLVDRITASKRFCAAWNTTAKGSLQGKKGIYDDERAAAAAGGGAAGGADNTALLTDTVTKLGANIFSECIENKVQFYDILCRRLNAAGVGEFSQIHVGAFDPSFNYTELKSRIDPQTKRMQEHRNIIDAIDGKNPVEEITRLQGLWVNALTKAVGKLGTFLFPLPEESRNRNIIIDKRDNRKNFFNDLFNDLQNVVNEMNDTKTKKLLNYYISKFKHIITCNIDAPEIFSHLLNYIGGGTGQGGGGKKQVGGTREEDIMLVKKQIKDAEAEIELINAEEDTPAWAAAITAADTAAADAAAAGMDADTAAAAAAADAVIQTYIDGNYAEYNRIYELKQYIQCCWSYLDYLDCEEDYDGDNMDEAKAAAAAEIAAAIPTILGQLRGLMDILRGIPGATLVAPAVGAAAEAMNGATTVGRIEEDDDGSVGTSPSPSQDTLPLRRSASVINHRTPHKPHTVGLLELGILSEGEDGSNAGGNERDSVTGISVDSDEEASNAGSKRDVTGSKRKFISENVLQIKRKRTGTKRKPTYVSGPVSTKTPPSLVKQLPDGSGGFAAASFGPSSVIKGWKKRGGSRKNKHAKKSKTRKNRPRFTNRTRKHKH